MRTSLFAAAAFLLLWFPLPASSQEQQAEERAEAAGAEEREAFDEQKFRTEFQLLLAQGEFDEASKQLKEAIEKHPDSERLRSLHATAYSHLRRAGRNEEAFEHLKAFTDYQMKEVAEGGTSVENFSQFLATLTDVGTQLGGSDRALAILDDYAQRAQELDGRSGEVLDAIDTQRALELGKANRVDEAQALLEKQVDAAREAVEQNPNDTDSILRMASALKNRFRLESVIEGGDPAASSSELLDFLFAKAKEQDDSRAVVRRFAEEHLNRAAMLARTEPDKADALLDRIETLGEEESDGNAEKSEEDEAASSIVRLGFGDSIARLRQQIEKTRKMLALIGSPAVYPENVDDWVNGEALSPESLKGKVVLLDFFAVWCGPCIATFPHLREWHEAYADQGLQIIGISNYYKYGWDEEAGRSKREPELEPEAERAAMEHFVKHHELQHPIAFVADRQLQEHYMVSGIPHAVVIDRQGKVRLFRIGSGAANAADLQQAIEESLSETPGGE